MVFPAPSAGDIVWCRFPEVESIQPGPKPRPALVLSVMDAEPEKPIRVRVMYGTTQATDRVGRGEFRIRKEQTAAFKASGLAYTTKFSCSKVVVLAYTATYFELAPKGGGLQGSSPVLGTLHATLMGAVRDALVEGGLLTHA